MQIEFWGVRGSVTTPDAENSYYGGNTLCTSLECKSGLKLVLDGGMGLRWYAARLLKELPVECHMLLSHCYWDHIQGIPFAPIMYIPGNQVSIYGFGGPTVSLRENLLSQMQLDFCPVPNFFLRDDVGATVRIVELDDHDFQIQDAVVTARRLPSGVQGSVGGFRVEVEGKVIAYLTDVEYPDGAAECEAALELARGADLLIHDAEYLSSERERSRGWGHSTIDEAVELAQLAQVKSLALFHHEPGRTDAQLDEVAESLKSLPFEAYPAREGLVIELE